MSKNRVREPRSFSASLLKAGALRRQAPQVPDANTISVWSLPS
jgi:hypothetical protein